MNPYQLWKRYVIGRDCSLQDMVEMFHQDQPKTGGFDTETDGLHIIFNKPFLIQFGWLVPKTNFGRVFVFDPMPENMKVFFELAKKFRYFLGHNIKFDLHMLTNIGYGDQVLQMRNIYDTLGVARLSLEAIPSQEGGDSLDLKVLGMRYVHPDAAKSEEKIKAELHKLKTQRIKILVAALKQFPLEGEFTANGRQRYWGKGAIEDFLKDITNEVEDLPDGVREVWLEWQKEYPEPTYADVDREIMIRYGADDIITMLEFFKKAYQTLLAREQTHVLDMESKCLLPLYKMERVGLKVDRAYLEESRRKVKAYIKKLRQEMFDICGERITVGQHAKIIEIYAKKWKIDMENAQRKTMTNIIENFTGEPKRLAEIIKRLRSLEKWYPTYIKRFLESSKYDGRAYTQINPYGTVTGRMSSDFQQFPKDALYDEDGNELFHPRKAFVTDRMTVYIDLSQVELRVQADYTIKVSGGDLNMCRAYMPFQCHRVENGKKILFEFHTLEKRQEWNRYEWYLNENPNEKWHPTDNHSETTHNALVLLGYECVKKYEEYHYKGDKEPFFKRDIDKDEFKKVRSKGKTFNFMRNYGGGLKAAMNNLGLPEEVAKALVEGFSKAFPHVEIYQQAVANQHQKKGYVQNMFGRRYYIQDLNRSYKLANYLVQGTCADMLKLAIIEIDEFIIKNRLKSKMIIPIHDEIQFYIAEGEEWAIPHFREMIEKPFRDWCYIPIEAGVEYTTSTWYAKKEWEENEAMV